MRTLRTTSALAAALFALLAFPAHALSNRIFVSTTGNDANDCSNPLTPCVDFTGALAQVATGGEIIAQATGPYGPLNITKSVTISGPPGVVIYSGHTVTVNAAGATVVLRGLTIDGTGASGSGIEVLSVGTLSVENCVIQGFRSGGSGYGIHMGVAGSLNIKNTDVTGCYIGVEIDNASGTVTASIDHCHLDSNVAGFRSDPAAPGGSPTTATNSTANNNSEYGWISGAGSSGVDLLNLEFCVGSQNGIDGLTANSGNASSATRLSNCVFTNNVSVGVSRAGAETVESRGNNTITGNGSGPTTGTIGSFSPL
jgi:Right handed beta helix region